MQKLIIFIVVFTFSILINLLKQNFRKKLEGNKDYKEFIFLGIILCNFTNLSLYFYVVSFLIFNVIPHPIALLYFFVLTSLCFLVSYKYGDSKIGRICGFLDYGLKNKGLHGYSQRSVTIKEKI